MPYTELLIGCGRDRKKHFSLPGDETFKNLITLDYNPDHKPDVLHDLNVHPLPFVDNTFDEIHAYEVLEHLATQGDYKFFFAEFTEYSRILKPDGKMFISIPNPNSQWAWGDPSHTRVLPLAAFTFLSQAEYDTQIGVTTMSDFRSIYKADFKMIYAKETEDTNYVILQVEKKV